jgi:hypothetical protein
LSAAGSAKPVHLEEEPTGLVREEPRQRSVVCGATVWSRRGIGLHQ